MAQGDGTVVPAETAFVDAVRRMLWGIEKTFPASFQGTVTCYLVAG